MALSPTGSEVDRLASSTAHLLVHVASCQICREAGSRYCSELDELASIVREDRREVLAIRDLSA